MNVTPDVLTWALRRLRPLRHVPGPEHKSILVVDIAAFGRWRDPAQIQARQVVRDAVRTGLRAAGVRWSDLAVQDRGDGMMVLVPATVSKLDLLDPAIPRLVAVLRRHNDTVPPGLRIRVRLGLHAGEVHRDPDGWVGSELNTACRLTDSAPVRERLGDHAVLVVSEVIHQGVVRHGYRRVDPAAYNYVEVALKELRTRAWVTTRF
jgi:class 3 adenylate cyclase